MSPLTRSRAWRALAAHRKKLARTRIADLFARDARRFERFSLRLDGLLLDYSKNLLSADTARLLVALARERGVAGAARRMFEGRKVNASERRAALHTALRGERPVKVDGADVMPLVRETLARMRAFCNEVRGGSRVTDVVSLGIGGSHLGPALVTQALAPYADGPRVHFAASVDGAALARTLKPLDPASTLVVVISKTFTTVETLSNARAVRAWLGGAAARNLAAVTANTKLALDFGVARERVFPFWDWVGGRYSLWSAAGLPAALAVGMDRFDELLRGAHAMDEHFRTAPPARNLPVMLALMGIWYNNFWGAATHAVLPYNASLALLPAWLQQLDMESSGKRAAADGRTVDYDTGAVIWGAPGTEAQHSFFQLLHQGTRLIPADFIAACRSPAPNGGSHAIMMANFFGQTAALMNGAPDEGFPGNRPSNSILLAELTPYALGMLLALYEHKVFVQNAIWGVNPFDQPGVELGKRLATGLLPELESRAAAASRDASTDGLITYYKNTLSQKPGGKP